MFKLVEVESWVSDWGLPAISTLCFVFVVTLAIVRALYMNKNKLEEMAAKPLDDGELKTTSSDK